MAWIPVDQSLRNHRKIVALAAELGVSEAAAAGHLVFLWLWCVDNAPNGIVKQRPTDDASKCIGNIRAIATAAAWRRNPNKLVNALLSAGFLEKCGRGGTSLRIHDWDEYGGKLCVARAKHRNSMRRSRAALEERRGEERRGEESRDPSPPPPPAAGDSFPEFLRIHEENFGNVTPSIERQLRKLSKEYSVEWFKDAVREACLANVLHLGYPSKVLARWSTEGKDDCTP